MVTNFVATKKSTSANHCGGCYDHENCKLLECVYETKLRPTNVASLLSSLVIIYAQGHLICVHETKPQEKKALLV